jgi:hypothetical protein
MIRVKNGAVLIEGDESTDIMEDLTCVIRAVKDTLEIDHHEETVREIIAFCGKLAYKSEEELEKEKADLLKEIERVLDGKHLN